MKKFLDRLLLGYLLQIPFMVVVFAGICVFRFFDSFYNTLVVQWVWGHPVFGIGFLLSTAISLIVTFLISRHRGGNVIGERLKHIALIHFFINIVEKWRVFRDLANAQGAILAPYYRGNSTFYPAVVTGIVPTEEHTYLVSVVFGDLPFPKPFLLQETEIVYSGLSFREAAAYALSWGFASELFKRKFKEETLGEYIRKSHLFASHL